MEFSGADADAQVEGSDVDDSEFTGDVPVPATLPWAEYRSAFRLTEREIDAAASAVESPTALLDMFGERILGGGGFAGTVGDALTLLVLGLLDLGFGLLLAFGLQAGALGVVGEFLFLFLDAAKLFQFALAARFGVQRGADLDDRLGRGRRGGRLGLDGRFGLQMMVGLVGAAIFAARRRLQRADANFAFLGGQLARLGTRARNRRGLEVGARAVDW